MKGRTSILSKVVTLAKAFEKVFEIRIQEAVVGNLLTVETKLMNIYFWEVTI
jgi:hypothetical protein